MNKYINRSETSSEHSKNVSVFEQQIDWGKKNNNINKNNNKIIPWDYIRTKIGRAYRPKIEKLSVSIWTSGMVANSE